MADLLGWCFQRDSENEGRFEVHANNLTKVEVLVLSRTLAQLQRDREPNLANHPGVVKVVGDLIEQYRNLPYEEQHAGALAPTIRKTH